MLRRPAGQLQQFKIGRGVSFPRLMVQLVMFVNRVYWFGAMPLMTPRWEMASRFSKHTGMKTLFRDMSCSMVLSAAGRSSSLAPMNSRTASASSVMFHLP